MFVHDFVHASAPAATVIARVIDDGGDRLSAAATEAAREGEATRARIGPAGPTPDPQAEARVEVRGSERRDASTVVAFTWSAVGDSTVFPSLAGDLEIAPFGPDHTQVSLMARYEAPPGVRERPDIALLHRVAAATVRSFLRRIAEDVEAA